jgi:putative colanic acid biosynthesis acetyltransferase WcaF
MQGKTDLSAFNNAWYKPGNPIKRGLWYLVQLCFFKSGFPISKIKVAILRTFGAKIGTGVVIKPHVTIKYPWNLIVGDHVWIGENAWIDNLAKVTIKSNACISQGALLLCGNHNYKKSAFDLIIGEITLEEGVWIGAKCTVCPGVKCGSHSLLTVGSIATAHLEPYSIYQGNPAVKIKDRVINS